MRQFFEFEKAPVGGSRFCAKGTVALFNGKARTPGVKAASFFTFANAFLWLAGC